MPSPLVECVPNFSEGRDAETLHQIASAIREIPGVLLLGDERDPDHNRSVFTFVGPPDAVVEAAVRAAAVAVERIDLRRHKGVHPRIGALDVLPFVPVAQTSLAECAELARVAAQQLWERCGIPCYLYEAAALRPERRNLADVRRGEFEELSRLAPTDRDRQPDVGGPALHPTAGATAVGARKFLIAWNVMLETADVSVARSIAALIRQSSGGFPFVKALGLALPQRGITQVSMNLTDFEETPMQPVFDAILQEANKRDVGVVGSELIGFVPRRALETNFRESLRLENFRSESVLENRIETLQRQREDGDASSFGDLAAGSLAKRAARLLTEAISWGPRLVLSPSPENSSLDWQTEWRLCQRLAANVADLADSADENDAVPAQEGRLAETLLEVASHCVTVQTWLASERSRLNAHLSAQQQSYGLQTIRHLLGASLGFAIASGLKITASAEDEHTHSLRDRFAALETLL